MYLLYVLGEKGLNKPIGVGLIVFIVNISLEHVLHTCHYKEKKNIQHTYAFIYNITDRLCHIKHK